MNVTEKFIWKLFNFNHHLALLRKLQIIQVFLCLRMPLCKCYSSPPFSFQWRANTCVDCSEEGERQVVYNQGAIYKQIDGSNVRQALRGNTHLARSKTSCTLLICCVCTLVNESFETQILLGTSASSNCCTV